MEKKIKARANRMFVGSILMAAICLSSYIAFTNYWEPLSAHLNVSIAQISLLISIAGAASLVSSLLMGTFLKMLRLRVLVIIASVCLMVFFATVYFSNSIVALYIAAVPFGFSTVAGGFATAQTGMAWWFPKGLGKRMGFLSIGLAVIVMLVSPAVGSALAVYEVGLVALVQGLATGVAMILCALFLLAEKPSVYGYETADLNVAFGQVSTSSADTGGQQESVQQSEGLTVKQILATAPFWMIIAAVLVSCIATTGYSNNASTFYQSLGLDAFQASLCISAVALTGLVWGPLFGALLDKFGIGRATLMQGGLVAVVFFLATFVARIGFVPALAVAALLGASSFTGMLGPVAFPKIYGAKEAGSLIGFASTASATAAMIGAPIAGFIFTLSGSYEMFMIFSGVCVAICVALVMLATRAHQNY